MTADVPSADTFTYVNIGLVKQSSVRQFQEQFGQSTSAANRDIVVRKSFASAGPHEIVQIAICIDEWRKQLSSEEKALIAAFLFKKGADHIWDASTILAKQTLHQLRLLASIASFSLKHHLEPVLSVFNRKSFAENSEVDFGPSVPIRGDTTEDVVEAIGSLLQPFENGNEPLSGPQVAHIDEYVIREMIEKAAHTFAAIEENLNRNNEVQRRETIQSLIRAASPYLNLFALTDEECTAFKLVEKVTALPGLPDIRLTRIAAIFLNERNWLTSLEDLANTNAGLRIIIDDQASQSAGVAPRQQKLIRDLFARSGSSTAHILLNGNRLRLQTLVTGNLWLEHFENQEHVTCRSTALICG